MQEGLVESEAGLVATPEDTHDLSRMTNGNVVDISAAVEQVKAPRMLYSRGEAAYQLSISERALDYLVGKKEIMVRRMGRKILIPHAELVRFSRKDHEAFYLTR